MTNKNTAPLQSNLKKPPPTLSPSSTKTVHPLAQQTITGFIQVEGQTRRTAAAKTLNFDDDLSMTDDTTKKKDEGYYDGLDSDDVDDEDDTNKDNEKEYETEGNTNDDDMEKKPAAMKTTKKNKKMTINKTIDDDAWNDNLDQALAEHEAEMMEEERTKKQKAGGKIKAKRMTRAGTKKTLTNIHKNHSDNTKKSILNKPKYTTILTHEASKRTSNQTNRTKEPAKAVIELNNSSSSEYDTDDPEDEGYKAIINKRAMKKQPTITKPPYIPPNNNTNPIEIDLEENKMDTEEVESDEEKFTPAEMEKIKKVYSKRLADQLETMENAYLKSVEDLRVAMNQRKSDRE